MCGLVNLLFMQYSNLSVVRMMWFVDICPGWENPSQTLTEKHLEESIQWTLNISDMFSRLWCKINLCVANVSEIIENNNGK